MTTTPHPLHQAVHHALRHYDNVVRLESNALTSLYALWPLPADHWHESLAAPRLGIALRRLLDNALVPLATRLPHHHTLLVQKYRHKQSIPTLQKAHTLSKAALHRGLKAAIDALAAEIAALDEVAAPLAQQRLATQTAFLPGYAPDRIVGLAGLLDSFLAALRQRLSRPRTPILITGLGGIGKTTLLDRGLRLWLLQEAPAVAGVLYVRVASGDRSLQATSSDILNAILLQLSVQLDTNVVDPTTPEAGLSRLAAHLADAYQGGHSRYVIVLDDIESVAEHEAGLRFARVLSGAAIVVLASRQNPELATVRGAVVEVQELNKHASATLVRAVRATTAPSLPALAPAEVKQIVATVGGHPLALGLVVAQVGLGRMSLDEVLAGLREKGALSEHLYNRIYERSWALLSDLARKVLAWFTNYPTSGVTAVAMQALKTMVTETTPIRVVERAVGELTTLNLLQRTLHPHEGFALHRLTYEFVEYKTSRRSPLRDVDEGTVDDDDDDFFFAND